MKKLLLLFAVLATAFSASAYDFAVDGIYYNFASDQDLICEVTSGENPYTGDIVIPSEVTFENKTYNVFRIGKDAFKKCDKLTSVIIPNSIKIIYTSAFAYCTKLVTVKFGNSVLTIESNAFDGCTSLKEIELPNSLEKIGSCAFQNCQSLTSVVIPIPVKEIGVNAFVSCSRLISVELPSSLTTIGASAFGSCPRLQSFTGKFASEDKRLLIVDGEAIAFAPDGVNSYSIPANVNKIAGGVFNRCKALTSIEIPNSVTNIGESAFGYCLVLTSIEIPNSVTEIGNNVLQGCSNLKTVKLSNAISKIPNYMFGQCSSLTSVEIPENVTNLGKFAFVSCKELTTLTLPSKVAEIGLSAFRDCAKLAELTSLNPVPPTFSDTSRDPFEGISKTDCVLNVPEAAVEAYKAADYWKDFTKIVGIAETGLEYIENELPANSVRFNLVGLPVNEGAKGIVIEGGKKVLRK